MGKGAETKMRKEVKNRRARWKQRALAIVMSGLLGICSFWETASVMEVSAETIETDQSEQSTSEKEQEYTLEGQELTDSKEVSDLISDTWDDNYFGSIVVDTDAGEVEIDGEMEELPEGQSKEENLEGYMETLPEDTLYNVEETDEGQYEITAPFQTKRLIVEATDLPEDYDAAEVYYNTELNETILQFDTEEETKKAFEALCQIYGEEKCYPDEIYYMDDILTDDMSVSSGVSYSWGTAYMGMNTLKEQAEGKYGAITVAILDTGIDKSNFMFQSRSISSQSYNFIDGNRNVTDNHGHGTHVAGIIADATPTNVRFLILKISNSSGYSSLLTIKTALQYALNQNISVVNMSLGFVAANAMSCTYLDSLINKAYRSGIAICAAAGNNGVDVSFCYPACNSKTLAIAAFGPNERAASYSNRGSLVDFSAPGSEIVSAAAGGFLIGMSGTSMSAPHITAAVAYLKMIQPNLSVQGIYNELKARCKDLGISGKDDSFGWGCPILTNLLHTGIINKTNVVAAKKSSVATPVIKIVKSVNGGIRISWKKVKNADKYIIYRKKGNGSFKKVKTVSRKTKAWTDKNVTQGKKYTYAVKAVKNKKSGNRSNTKTTVYLKQPQKVTLKRKSNGNLLVKWAKVSQTSGYEICYAANKKMKNAKSVTVLGKGTRKVLSGLKNKVYYCRVRACKNMGGKQYYSAWSAVKKMKRK